MAVLPAHRRPCHHKARRIARRNVINNCRMVMMYLYLKMRWMTRMISSLLPRGRSFSHLSVESNLFCYKYSVGTSPVFFMFLPFMCATYVSLSYIKSHISHVCSHLPSLLPRFFFGFSLVFGFCPRSRLVSRFS